MALKTSPSAQAPFSADAPNVHSHEAVRIPRPSVISHTAGGLQFARRKMTACKWSSLTRDTIHYSWSDKKKIAQMETNKGPHVRGRGID